MITIKSPKFNIGDRVFHITRDSIEGVVIDSNYNLRDNCWTYIVTFGAGDDYNMYEDELTYNKVF